MRWSIVWWRRGVWGVRGAARHNAIPRVPRPADAVVPSSSRVPSARTPIRCLTRTSASMNASRLIPRTSTRQLALAAALTLLAAACHDDRTAPTLTTPLPATRAVSGSPNQQDWKQCENGKNPSSVCSWVTGNLDASHNEYLEGQFVPHVLYIGNITNTDPFTVVMTFGFMKGGKTAHDFLGTWNRSMTNANPCVDGSFSGLCTSGSLTGLYTTTQDLRTLFRTQAKAVCNATGDGYVDAALNAVTDNDVRIQGKNVSDIQTAVTYGSCPIGTGDAEATVTFTVTPTAAGVSNGVLLLLGSHIARGPDWQNGGASSIPGSPYHLGLVTVGGNSAGSMDLQMQSGAVVIPGTLTIVKRIVNDNGGTATVSSFGLTSSAGSLTFDGGTPDGTSTIKYTSNTMSLSPGTYTLHEDDVAGYTEGSWSCTGNTGSVTTLFSAGSVAVANGQTVVCTITNDDQQGSLQLVKRVVNDNGGTATVSNFSLATTAGSPVFGAGAPDGANTLAYSSQVMPVNAGSYTLTESDVTGYAEGSWSCSAGTLTSATFNAGSVTIPAATAVVCTITNNDQQASLVLRKRVVNDNGGTATVTSFSLATTAGTPVFDAGVADGANTLLYTSSALAVNAGSYTLTESDVAGYAEGSWSCTGGTLTSATFNAGAVTVPAAGNVVCTITNNDVAPSLTLDKVTSYTHGGTRPESDWSLAAAGPTPISGAGAAGHTDVVSGATFSAGTYTLSETGTFTGYLNGTSYSCVKNGGAPASGNSITLGVGDVAICTITNTDVGGTLTLVKRVVNDNGGTATVTNFSLTTNAGSPTFGAGTADGTNTLKYTSNALAVNAGTYSLVESDVAGYTEGTWSCDAGTLNNGAFGAGSISVPLATNVTCTITNNDVAPSLTLNKVTSYSYGGTRPESDWTLAAAGPTPLSGAGASGSTDVVSGATFSAGTYTLSETGTYAGYQNGTSYSCVKNGGAPVSGNSITLAVADVAVCTITNTDLPGTITIIKNVAGQGGTFDFTTTGTGLSAFSLLVASNGTNQQSFSTLSAGSYSVTESPAPGYTLTGLSCTAGGTADYTVSRTATITLPLGGSVTCTYENTRNTMVTRTQGFWATHLAVTHAVWFGGSVGGNTFAGMSVTDQTLCPAYPLRVIDTDGKLMGGFWSNIAKTSTKGSRSDLDQARMQLLQQLLAAKLNQAAFGSVPTTGMSISAAQAAYCGTDLALIKTAAGNMGAFNEFGDSGLFTPGVSANGKQAKDGATLSFWDLLP